MIDAMALRFKLGENIPGRACTELQAQGHNVETAASEGLSGATDEAILQACANEERILVTLDLDFSNIRDYPPAANGGIWVLRPATQSITAVIGLVNAGVRLATVEDTRGQLWVIDERRIRIRQ